jgi:hypothetical protein
VGAGWWQWSSCGVVWWSSSRSAAVIFVQRRVAVFAWSCVAAALRGGRLCAALRGARLRVALHRHCLRAALRRCCLCVVLHRRGTARLSSSRSIVWWSSLCGVTWRASSHGIALRRCRLHAALRGCCLCAALCGGVFTSPGGCRRAAVVFTCRRTAVVFVSPLLTGRCHLRCHGHCCCPVAEGQRHIPSRAPANSGGCAGAGRKRATAMPLRRHDPVCTQTGGTKGGGGCAEEGRKGGGGPAPVLRSRLT